MLKKPLKKSFLINTLIINIIISLFGITLYARYPTVAFGDSNYLVVWQDLRGSTNWDIYGARVNQSGNILDTAGIAISTTPGGEYSPSIAFDGINYLVVWIKVGDGIYGARVDQLGVVVDTTKIKICDGYSTYSPAVAFGDSNYLVVWHDYRNSIQRENADIYGAHVDQAGNVLDTAGLLISTAPDTQKYPTVAFDGTNYLVVWEDSRNGYSDIYGTRVNQSGNILDTAGIAISTDTNRQIWPSISFDGVNYLVVWEDYRNVYSDIYGARVNQSGGVLDTTEITISTAVDSQYSPAVAFDGTNYLVVWQDKRNGIYDIYGTRVDQSGNVLDTAGIYISTSSTGIEEEDDIIFDYFFLSQNYPNPFIRSAKISYTLAKASRVNLKVYDISGRLVTILVDSFQNAGTHEVIFDGSGFASGVYIYRLQASKFTETRKMIFVR